MDYFPAFLNLRGRAVLLVGGGSVATRKARLLLAAGARITVVAPTASSELQAHVRKGGVQWQTRCFKARDLERQWLVVSATGNPAVEALVSRLASDRGVFCNTVDQKESCSFITPAIVDRSPVIVAISSGGAAPVLARRIRARIESLLPTGIATLAGVAGRYRSRVAHVFTTLPERLRFWETYFDRAIGVGTQSEAEDRILELLAQRGEPAPGQAWLVGAGPGDPELLTLRALQCLQTADVIVHDRLGTERVLELARRDAERIDVGKLPGSRNNRQEDINALLIRLVRSGKQVCRLKGGDPFIFGRGGEEAEALRAEGLSVSVVPGITAAAGCAAASGIPLTHRDAAQSVVFLTAHGKHSVDTLDWASLARDRQTLAVYMGVSRYPTLSRELIRHGCNPATPVAIIEKGTTPEQRIVTGTLGQLPWLAEAHSIDPPALLIIGEVVRYGCAPQVSMALNEAVPA